MTRSAARCVTLQRLRPRSSPCPQSVAVDTTAPARVEAMPEHDDLAEPTPTSCARDRILPRFGIARPPCPPLSRRSRRRPTKAPARYGKSGTCAAYRVCRSHRCRADPSATTTRRSGSSVRASRAASIAAGAEREHEPGNEKARRSGTTEGSRPAATRRRRHSEASATESSRRLMRSAPRFWSRGIAASDCWRARET